MKSRIVYQTYTEQRIVPSDYHRGNGLYDMGYRISTGEPATFKLTNDVIVKELIVDEYFVRDGFIEISGEELGMETLIPIHRILVIEPYDGPRTEPVEKGLRTF